MHNNVAQALLLLGLINRCLLEILYIDDDLTHKVNRFPMLVFSEHPRWVKKIVIVLFYSGHAVKS